MSDTLPRVITFEEIQVGDTIRSEYTTSGMRQTREGVVARHDGIRSIGQPQRNDHHPAGPPRATHERGAGDQGGPGDRAVSTHGGFSEGSEPFLLHGETVCDTCRYTHLAALGYCPACNFDRGLRDSDTGCTVGTEHNNRRENAP